MVVIKSESMAIDTTSLLAVFYPLKCLITLISHFKYINIA